MPEVIGFQTKPEIALDQIRAALADGVAPGLVLADTGYGIDTAFRTALTALGLRYSLGVQSSTSLRAPGYESCPMWARQACTSVAGIRSRDTPA